MQSLIYVITQI